jgi:phospholipid/cholesterol/gamma-HCH transport system ATP-binding protein
MTVEAIQTEPTSDAILEVRDLVVKYGTTVVLKNINLDVKRGENFVILGGSGCGKSTLLRNLVGLMRPASGTIRYNGENFTAMSDTQRVSIRRKMGMCFQGSALFGSMTVGENVGLPLREHTRLSRSVIDIMTEMKLRMVGLDAHVAKLPSQLSGGQQKRAGLARAMAMDPDIIFYDEPSAGLDPIVAAELDQLIRNMQQTFNLTSVVVTHEMESVKIIADTVCMLKPSPEGGRIVYLGDLDGFYKSPDPDVIQFRERIPNEERREEEEELDELEDELGSDAAGDV